MTDAPTPSAELARLQLELRSAEDREAALHDVIQTIAQSRFDLDLVLQTVIDRAVELCGAENGNIARRDGDVYRVVAFKSFTPDYERLVRERVYVPERVSAIGRALLERSPVHIRDVLDDPDYSLPELQRAGGFRTILAVPMLRDGEPMGAIAVGRNEVRPFTDAEVRLIEAFADHVLVAIENVRLFQTVERQRAELAGFAPHVASLLTTRDGEQLLAGHRREITALFCDLRGFTAFAETADPEDVMGLVCEYHAAVGEVVVANNGTVEHFAGDGIMVLFNDPAPVANHHLVAVRSGVDLAERFAALAAAWRRRGYELGLGVGVASGYATIGRVGFEGQYAYGAIGNALNLAARLSDAAAAGEILISQRTLAAVDGRVVTDEIRELQLKGFSRPVVAARVVDVRE